ncbi:MAG: GNAT family N-acetyltransferase [Paracoccaceae bacterium]
MPPTPTLRDRLEAGAIALIDAEGPRLRVRPIRRSDAPSMMRGYDALSEQGKWFRMLHALPHLSPKMAERLCSPDPETDLCVVVEGRPEIGGLADELLGGARIAGCRRDAWAEFAVSVRPEARGRGLAKGCLRIVLAAVGEMGCAGAYGIVSRRNAPMIGLARALGLSIRPDPHDAALLRAEIAVEDIPPFDAVALNEDGPAARTGPPADPGTPVVRPPARPSSS